MGSRRLQDFLSDSTFTDCSQGDGGGELNGNHLGKETALDEKGNVVKGRGDNPNPPGNPDPPGQLIDLQLLAFNDYHGHVQPGDAGTVAGVPAGGGEYLSAKLNELRNGNKYSLTVAAGDLIGGSPAFSGLFHDEPSVESLNAVSSVYKMSGLSRRITCATFCNASGANISSWSRKATPLAFSSRKACQSAYRTTQSARSMK